MKNSICIVILTFFTLSTTGCATTRPVTKFDQAQLNTVVDNIMGLNNLRAPYLKNKKIFTEFRSSQLNEHFLEIPNFLRTKVEKHKYVGDLSQDIQSKLNEVLTSLFKAKIVKIRDEADIVINANIEQIYSQVLELNRRGVLDCTNFFNVITSTLLSINNKIEFKEKKSKHIVDWRYNHLISLDEEFSDQQKTTIITEEVAWKRTFIAKYDNRRTLATGALVETGSAFLLFPLIQVRDYKGSLVTYDLEDGSKKHEYSIGRREKDILKEIGRSSLDTKCEEGNLYDKKKTYFSIFLTPHGNMKYLIYDYIKELLVRLNAKRKLIDSKISHSFT